MLCKYKIYLLLLLGVIVDSCTKLVQIDPPADTIVSEEAFNSDNNATTSVLGIYSKLIDQSNIFQFGNMAVTMLNGVSADDIYLFPSDPSISPFFQNQILPDNGLILRLWQGPYEVIYRANACLEQLIDNPNITPALREQLIGEAKFLRAYCYFYLINMFGDVPYLTTTNYKSNSIASKNDLTVIYSNIINDLKSTLTVLPDDYSAYNNERDRATKWAAMGLLSRIYLYTKNWTSADSCASSIISNSNFSLEPDLKNVFIKNSNEAIFQLAVDGSVGNFFNVVPESVVTIPYDQTSPPTFYIPNTFLNEFETVDKRKTTWLDSTVYSGDTYYYPFKYRLGPTDISPNSSPAEYYMVLRLAEQYLIRAEAKAHEGDLAGAVADMNIIRTRAGLASETFNSLDDAINKILEERKKELFYEWGQRWFDLKRTGKIDSVMRKAVTLKNGTWNVKDTLFPIPSSEILNDPNLTQNPGY